MRFLVVESSCSLLETRLHVASSHKVFTDNAHGITPAYSVFNAHGIPPAVGSSKISVNIVVYWLSSQTTTNALIFLTACCIEESGFNNSYYASKRIYHYKYLAEIRR